MHIFDSNNLGLNEIVFENRNKEYGAFEIRQTNAQRHWYSFFIGVSIYLLVLISFYYWLNLKDIGKTFAVNKKSSGYGCCYCGTLESQYLPDFEEVIFKVYNQRYSPPHVIPDHSTPPQFLKVISTDFLRTKKSIFYSRLKINHYLINYSKIFKPTSERLNKAQPIDSTIIYSTYFEDSNRNRTPRFKNDMQGIEDFMKENFQYPQEAFINCIEAKVFVQFVLETDGSFSNIKLLNKTGFGCDEEALRLIKLMPRWSPAYKKGQKVQSKITIPIIFKIE